MNNIDWDTAPEGFPLWLEAKHKGCSGFVRDDGDRYRYPDMSYYTKAEEGALFSIHHQISWDGEGLPPVGADVECTFAVEMHEIWHRGTVVHCATSPEGDKFVVVDTGEVSACYRVDGTCLRPYRTPEQIAADERESHINGMLCHDALGSTRRGLAEALYDAGYRRVEQ